MTDQKYRHILMSQIMRYPKMEIDDLYKLIHQANMGSEHAVRDIVSARKWLEMELSALEKGMGEPIMEEISADGQIVRVHLWPFKQQGGNEDELQKAFIQTANNFAGSEEGIIHCWSIAEKMAEAGDLPFDVDSLRIYLTDKEQMRFPAVHHSRTYEEEYKPAYRVVAAEFL